MSIKVFLKTPFSFLDPKILPEKEKICSISHFELSFSLPPFSQVVKILFIKIQIVIKLNYIQLLAYVEDLVRSIQGLSGSTDLAKEERTTC